MFPDKFALQCPDKPAPRFPGKLAQPSPDRPVPLSLNNSARMCPSKSVLSNVWTLGGARNAEDTHETKLIYKNFVLFHTQTLNTLNSYSLLDNGGKFSLLIITYRSHFLLSVYCFQKDEIKRSLLPLYAKMAFTSACS
jgi:S-formylglutathione hydrolase FrmB